MTAATLSRARGIEVMAILIAINCLNMVDRNLPFILAEAIKADLALSDQQLGLLGGMAFAIVYALGGIPFGRLADRGLGRQTVAGAVALWSVMTALGGAAQSFAQLATARLGLAAGEAALAPGGHAIIAAHFPERKRATMIALFAIGVPIGFMLGMTLGGWLVDNVGWRMAFVAVGIPGMIMAVIAWLRLPGAPQAHSSEPQLSLGDSLRYLWSKRTFRLTAIAGSLYSFAGYSMNTFMPAFIMRSHGLSAAETGLWLGLILGISGLIGMPLSGWLADRLAQRDVRWQLRIPAILMLTSAPFFVGALLADNAVLALAMLFVPQMLINSYLGPTFSAMHALVPPNMRALATSCQLGLLTLVGASLGPLVVGTLSDSLSAQYGRHALSLALLLVPAMLAISSLWFELAARRLPEDIYRPDS